MTSRHIVNITLYRTSPNHIASHCIVLCLRVRKTKFSLLPYFFLPTQRCTIKQDKKEWKEKKTKWYQTYFLISFEGLNTVSNHNEWIKIQYSTVRNIFISYVSFSLPPSLSFPSLSFLSCSLWSEQNITSHTYFRLDWLWMSDTAISPTINYHFVTITS